jgi:hypothetical protein
MTDIFFSYSSKDRDRVRPVRNALAAQGFDVFWDQEVPTGLDWDRWIRDHLNKAKCALVFWSMNSIASDNVRHEATVAKQHGKLVPVMLDALTAEQFPMGLYAVQGANLGAWAGDAADANWLNLQREIESKLTPAWVRRTIDTLEAELVAERARRESAERRDRTLRDQIVKEAQAQQELRRERDHALDEMAELKTRLEQRSADGHAQQAARRQLDQALQEVSDLKAQQASLSDKLAAAQDKIQTIESDNDTLATANKELQKEIKTLEALQLASFANHFDATLKSSAPARQGAPKRGGDARAETKERSTVADRHAVAIAAAFAIAVPFVLIGFAILFETMGWSFFGLYDGLASAILVAGPLILTVALIRIRLRRAPLAGIEIALYWLGCAVALVVATSGLTLGMHWSVSSPSRYAETGLLFASLGALASAPLLIRRHKQPLAGTEIAIYWFGCALAIAVIVCLANAVFFEWSAFADFGWGPTSLFAGAVAAIITAITMVHRRRLVLEGNEIAFYWMGTSLALAVAIPALFSGMHWDFSVSFPVVGLLVLVSGIPLVRRRKPPLGVAETAIYWLGLPAAAAVLMVFVLSVLGSGIRSESLPGLLLVLLIAPVMGFVAWLYRRRRAAKASMPG